MESRRVKTNVTLPLWLKELAETQKVNYSRLLENSLLEYLGVKKLNTKSKEQPFRVALRLLIASPCSVLVFQ